MSIVRIYNKNVFNFIENGPLGYLTDCISCVVTEERNGQFELEMQYPMDGNNAEFIELKNIIMADASPAQPHQAFRIYSISKPINGIITVDAHHISYDLTRVSVIPFSATNIADAFTGFNTYDMTDIKIRLPFRYITERTTQGNFSVDVPSSVRSLLAGQSGSILDVYGGEFKFDNYNVYSLESRGSDNGVTIEYGNNLTDFNHESHYENNVYSIIPFWKSSGEDGNIVCLPFWRKTIPGATTNEREGTIPIDFTGYFESEPTVEELDQKADQYIASSGIGNPVSSLSISFADLAKTEEYKNEGLQRIELCDTVTIKFSKYNYTSTAKIVKTVYDALKGMYKSVEIGKVKESLGDTVVNIKNDVDTKTNSTEVRQAAKVSSTTVESNGKVWFETYRDAIPKAVPYTSTSSGLSEIVTKQDLINLGLI